MLIIEWLLRLPGADGILVSDKTATNSSTDEEATEQALALWPGMRLRDNHTPDGFQIVDQDGRMFVGRFMRPGQRGFHRGNWDRNINVLRDLNRGTLVKSWQIGRARVSDALRLQPRKNDYLNHRSIEALERIRPSALAIASCATTTLVASSSPRQPIELPGALDAQAPLA